VLIFAKRYGGGDSPNHYGRSGDLSVCIGRKKSSYPHSISAPIGVVAICGVNASYRARQLGLGLEHRIAVGRGLRDGLDDIPVLYHFAILDTEEVGNGIPPFSGFANPMAVQDDDVSV
jgi:hypothetical protein